MAYTNCNIIFVDSDKNNKTKSITVSRLGFPGYTGRLLLTYYNKNDKVKELMDLGNLYQIGKDTSCNDKNMNDSFEMKIHKNETCIAYKRDYSADDLFNVDLNEPTFKDDIEAIRVLDKNPAQFTYMWKDDKWYFRKWRSRLEEMNYIRISHDEEEDG